MKKIVAFIVVGLALSAVSGLSAQVFVWDTVEPRTDWNLSEDGEAIEDMETREEPEPFFKMPPAFSDIIRSPQIDTLLYRKMLSRVQNPDMGFRILIFSQSGNNSKNAAVQAKREFEELYPGTEVYMSFEEPSFKVKAGNFLNRVDAQFFLRDIKLFYPYAFIVKDKLDIGAFLEENTDWAEE